MQNSGADCRLFRTLDRFGKGADTTVTEMEATDFSSQMLQFRIRAGADFPIRQKFLKLKKISIFKKFEFFNLQNLNKNL